MKKNILIAGILSAISLAAISQASDNPWEYYWAGSSQKKSRSYSQSYNETTYGVGIKGLYAWASQDWEPDMGGVLADFYENISTESVIHQLSITSGYMKGSHDFGIQDTSRKIVPLLGGYTLHVPVCASASMINTPGITGFPGKCPAKYGSLKVTFFRPTARTPGSSSSIVSISRNGCLWGRISMISCVL